MRVTPVQFFCGKKVKKAGLSVHLRISVAQQRLTLFGDSGDVQCFYPVSTAARGVGMQRGSFCTPTGKHLVRAKIGAGLPENTIFVARRPTGEIYSQELATANPARDWILSRILWLSGCEPHVNRLGSVDTMRRYIYIHGCPDSEPIGVPKSHGCIRMRNRDIVELFELVPIRTPVEIT